MNRFARLSTALFAALFFAALSSAQLQRSGQYYQVPGRIEFTGQMIVRPKQASQLSQAGLGPLEQLIVRTRAAERIQPLALRYENATDEYIIAVPQGHDENTFSVWLLATGDYQYAEPNWRCFPTRSPNDPMYNQQWHHPRVKSPQAWDLVTGSANITCAVVDTGIDVNHPDLTPNRVPGYNSVTRTAEVDGGQVNDLNGHGTHVAGDAAAFGNNAKGVAGMGWNFKIMMIRTSDSPGGGASIADITAGARWAADNGAKSISASYSGVDAAAVGTTGTYIKGKNALFLYAAGNDNRDLTGLNHPDTIVVGASNESDGKAGFSAYGLGVHVFAPGTNIRSTTLGGGYGPSSGTSMSAPVANGAVALIWAMNPTLTSQQVQTILEANCDAIGPTAIFNKGRINQYKNVLAANALLIAPADVLPSGITTTLGTHATGSLSDILSPNTGGPSWDDFSAQVPSLGHAAAQEVSYVTSALPNKLESISYVVQAKVDRPVLTTGFLYGWSFQTGKWVLLGQTNLSPTGWATKTIKVSGSNAKRYLGPGGEVKTLFRTVGARVGGRVSPIPFQAKLGHAKLVVATRP